MSLKDDAEAALNAVRTEPLIAFDTETTGLDWHNNVPVGYVITVDEDQNWYIPIRHGGGENLMCHEDMAASSPMTAVDGPWVQHSFERELADAFVVRNALGYTTVLHNAKFDAHMSFNTGISLGRGMRDTGIMQALINEFSRVWTLDGIAKLYGIYTKSGDEMYAHLAKLFGGEPNKKIMEHFWRTSGRDPIAVKYAKGDGITTLDLYNEQIVKIEEQGLERVHELEGRLIWTTFRMERRGIHVDLDYCEKIGKEADTRNEEAMSHFPEGFNPRSGKQMMEFMTEKGHTDWPLTEKGNPSFPEKWLSTFPLGEKIVEARRWSHLKNSFLTPLLEQHVIDGKVHCTLNQSKIEDFGTIGGRYSCTNPNMQAIPKRDKDVAKVFRPAFIASPGMKMWERDYSQCEPRLFAHYAREQKLIDGYNQDPPLDMHHFVHVLLNVDRDSTAKRMNMGILTGMGVNTFGLHMGWERSKAKEKYNEWFEAFPGIRDFQDKAKRVFKSRRYVTTLLGRRCRLEDQRFAYKAVSRIIQGGNADIIKYVLLRIDEFFESIDDVAWLNLTIHDSVMYETPLGPEGDAISEEVGKIMSDVNGEPFNLSVPFTTDAGGGENWSIATFGE